MFRLGGFGELIAMAGSGLMFVQVAHGQSPTNGFSFQEYLLAPVRVHLLSAKDSPAIQTTLMESDITRILGKLNGVWSQAGLHFYLESLVREEANQSGTYSQPAGPDDRSVLLGLRPRASLATNVFHIYYLKKLVMNGICFSEGIFVKDTASLQPVAGGLDEPIPRVTSHELGHTLGLSHRQNTTNLMASGTTGTWLNEAEINQVRAAARKLSWINPAPELLKKADVLFRAKKMIEAAILYSGLATIPLAAQQVDLAKKRSAQATRIDSNSKTAQGPRVEFRPQWVRTNGVYGVEYWSGPQLVGSATPAAPAGIEVRLPGEPFQPVEFREKRERGSVLELGPVNMGSLTLRLRLERINPSLVRRTLMVTAAKAQQFAARFDFFPAFEGGSFAVFSGTESNAKTYDTLGGGPEYPNTAGQTFPMAAVRHDGHVFGVVADSPGQWENRCLVLVDPTERKLALMNGDGRDPYPLSIKYDAKDTYSYQMDGWQSLAADETRSYVTWLFTDRADSQYDVQLAAHLALANAKGWNHSALEAILRNTSYLLCRRNLMRNEGRYIFISGIGYGWKQWVTDGFYLAQGLADPEKMTEAYRSIFANRITYEDNAQYYLIWSALAKRAGGKLKDDLVRLAYEFIRTNERDGTYYPPRLAGSSVPKGFKTYMDVLPYEDDDPPASNQGFHCGALLAARELGFPVTDDDIERAVAGYRRMYNAREGFMPTSLKQPDLIGQDALYGEALTYAVFGGKLLTDDQVTAHMRTTLKIQSPYGMRVISKADGALMPGHSGEYVYGGSWFLCDAANYLVAGLHGMSADDVDRHLIWRIAKEIAYVPAFNESISTVTGKPHGHILYSWNSGYWWLRREFRKRLNQKGPDPVETAIDQKLGVVRDRYGLRLEPAQATLRPRD